jgi:antitoxin (DNA-binding transcriptional repressor) of toxin-antitoxin stability system
MDEIAVDIADSDGIAALADAVSRSGHEHLLCREGEVLARVVPERAPGERHPSPTADDRAAFLASAGGWADIDADELIERIYDQRRASVRPPFES